MSSRATGKASTTRERKSDSSVRSEKLRTRGAVLAAPGNCPSTKTNIRTSSLYRARSEGLCAELAGPPLPMPPLPSAPPPPGAPVPTRGALPPSAPPAARPTAAGTDGGGGGGTEPVACRVPGSPPPPRPRPPGPPRPSPRPPRPAPRPGPWAGEGRGGVSAPERASSGATRLLRQEANRAALGLPPGEPVRARSHRVVMSMSGPPLAQGSMQPANSSWCAAARVSGEARR